MVALLIDFSSAWNESFEKIASQLFRIQAQRREGLAEMPRMHDAGQDFEIVRDAMELVGDYGALNRFGGITGPPADHDAAFTALSEDIPQRLAVARKVGDALYAAPVRPGFHEAMNAVVKGALAGGDGGPQHRREGGLKGGDRSCAACADQAADVGHSARGHQR